MIARPLAAVAAAATLVLAAPSAHADVDRFSDPRGDAERLPRMSAESSADVTSTVGRHADGRMTVTSEVTDLTASNTLLRVQLATSEGPYFVQAGGRGERSSVLLYDEQFELVDCPGLRGGLRPARDVLSVSVPRPCLERPAWIRFGAATATFTAEGSSYWADDARRRGLRADGTFTVGRTRLRHN
ncbi:hypothetical protein [Nocardioides sp. CFH 31398]|uniref:hypothetical protein n=1 Tax=Nocardioides sp. CFH 31398 TaxID=2919579 RepID=UPI001F0571EA|nr:hypothetical protein [Nocardioides sp. CFH 31398]MCH1869056.1 hypothetical protein [Nocardioides sp. CFH 31398]